MALSHEPNLGLPKTKGITDLVYIKKSYKCYKILHFQVRIFQDQPWNLPDFMDEICRISWNPPDFMDEICQISWNPPNFTSLNPWFGTLPMIQCRETSYLFYWIFKPLIHEIQQISPWNLPNFMVKSAKFHGEIRQISWPWNSADFMVKSAGFHGKDLGIYQYKNTAF